MKKVFNFLGALVIALNLLFSVSLENNSSISNANADVDICASFIESIPNKTTLFLRYCVDDEGVRCGGMDTVCELYPAPGTSCTVTRCDVQL